MHALKVLVSNELDDIVGVEKLKKNLELKVVTYDPSSTELSPDQASAEVLIPPYRSSHRPIPLLGKLPGLRMVQLLSAGVDEWLEHVPEKVVVASARGAHAAPVSEWVISAILTQLRQWPALVRFQDEAIWAHRRFNADTLAGKRVLVLGAGSIGGAVARKLAALDAVPTLVASSAREGVHGSDDLPNIVTGHQIVVVTAPLNEGTRNLVNADFLARMDDGALLVNAGRGQIVDTEALIKEVQGGRLRAALDVTHPEPLPPDNPLWKFQNVIISPHSARTVPGVSELCYTVAAEQLTLFLKGERPTNAATR